MSATSKSLSAPPFFTAWLAAARGWSYAAAGRRDLRIDFLRGFAVFAMVVDHIGGNSPLYLLTGGNRFFVSAAEGFVFISGLMVGLVYRGEIARGGIWAGAVKALKRAWTLYALSVWLALAFAAVSSLLRLPWAPDLARGGWVNYVLGVVSATRTFYLVDVMLLYTFLLLLAPLALWALSRGWTWELLTVSSLVWFGYQLFPDALKLPWPIADNPVFNLAAWQILFFAGLTIGWHRERVAEWSARHLRPPALSGGWLLPLGAGVVCLIWLQATSGVALNRFAPDGDGGILLDDWFDKSSLPLPRLLASAVVFLFLWVLTSELWRPLSASLGRLLQPLGARALYSYAAHLFIVAGIQFLLMRLLPWQTAPGPDEAAGAHMPLPPLANAGLQRGGIAILWVLARARFLQDVVSPLGEPPFAFSGERLRRLRPASSFVALAAVVLVSGAGLLLGPASWASPPAAIDPDGRPEAPTSAYRPRVQTTVTAPRRVAGAARQVPAPAPAAAEQSPAAAEAEQPAPEAGHGDLAAEPEAAPTDEAAKTVAVGFLSDEEFQSAAMGQTMPFAIYLPPDYETSERRYPVLYMLHGAGGHYSEWVDFGLISNADRLIGEGKIQPFIIVLPQGDQSYWINWADDGPRWSDYVATDLVAYVDANYRTIPHRRARAIGGLSMGGYGALQIAFNHLDTFAVAGAHSPSLRPYEQALPFFGDEAYYLSHDPINLAKQAPRRRLAIWLDVGEDDQWRPRVEELHEVFHERGLPHDFRVFPGEHEYNYWIEHVDDYLRFYAENLRGE